MNFHPLQIQRTFGLSKFKKLDLLKRQKKTVCGLNRGKYRFQAVLLVNKSFEKFFFSFFFKLIFAGKFFLYKIDAKE